MSLTRQSEGRLPRNTLDISGATLTLRHVERQSQWQWQRSWNTKKALKWYDMIQSGTSLKGEKQISSTTFQLAFPLTRLNGFVRSWVWCCHMIQWQNTEIGVVSSFFQSCHMSSLINLFALEKLDFVICIEARVPRQQIWSSLMLSYDKHSSFNCSAQHWILSYLKDFWENHIKHVLKLFSLVHLC